MEFNLADLFESVVDVVPDREAVVCGERRLTYRALDERANRLAHHLQAAGIRPGQHVGVQLYNGPEYVETLLACLKIRAVPINVNYRYVAAELAYLYDNADLVALVFDAGLADAVVGAAPELGHFVVVGSGEATLPDATVRYEPALAAQHPARDFAPRTADDLYIIYTGGTTGMPKGVMWRHEDLFVAGMAGGNPYGDPASRPTDVAERVAAGGPGPVLFPVAPLIHGAAQLALFIAFFQGSTTVLVPRFDAEEVLRAIARERVNAINIVGDAMARPLADALAGPLAGLDVSSLGAVSSAGALLSDAAREALQAVLPATMILNNFGATETGYNGTGVGTDGLVRLSVNERTTVLDDGLRPMTPGSAQVGWFAHRRNVPLGYYKAPEASARTFVEIDGERWAVLGDRARLEADGTITVLGRDAVCINSGGEKVFAEEVEATLKAHPAVLDTIVAGMPDERFGERVAAVVQFGSTVARPSTEELQEHCRALLAGYKVPRLVVEVDEVRRSPSGKPDYPWARRLVADAATRAAAGATTNHAAAGAATNHAATT